MQNIYFIILKKNYRQYFFQNATNTIILTNFANYPTTTSFVQILVWRKFGEISDFGLKSPN